VHLTAGVWLTLRAARIGESAPSDRQDIAVTIELVVAGGAHSGVRPRLRAQRS
jgi:hypothetical protein